MSYRFFRKILFCLNLTCFFLAFTLIQRYSFQFDFTKNKQYSLSPITKSILKDLQDKLIITYYFSPTIKNYSIIPQEIQNFLEVYSQTSPLILYKSKEDNNLPFSLKELGFKEQKITLKNWNNLQNITYYSGIEILYKGKRAVLPFIHQEEDLEYALTTSIERLINPFMKKIGLILTENTDSIDGGFKALNSLLEPYNLQEVFVNDLKEINPSEIPLLIIIGSSLNYHQVETIKNYFNLGGSLLFSTGGTTLDILDNSRKTQSSEDFPLLQWLEELGISIKPNIVLDTSRASLINNGQEILRYPAILNLSISEINQNNALTSGLSQINYSWGSSIEIEETKSRTLTTLFTTSESSLLLEKNFSVEPNFINTFLKEAKDYQERFTKKKRILSVIIRKNSVNLNLKESRLLVIGSRYFFHDATLPFRGQNLDLLVRSVDWLLKKDSLVSLKKERSPIILTFKNYAERLQTHKHLLFINSFLMPFILLIIGSFYLKLRKNCSQKEKS